MSSRHRTCHHLLPNQSPNMPPPQRLAALGPLTGVLIDAAAAFDEIDPDHTWSAVEFARWLDVAVREAVEGRVRVAL